MKKLLGCLLPSKTESSQSSMSTSRNVLIGVTGSVATIKLEELVHSFQSVSSLQVNVKIVATEAAKHFIPTSLDATPFKETLQSVPGGR